MIRSLEAEFGPSDQDQLRTFEYGQRLGHQDVGSVRALEGRISTARLDSTAPSPGATPLCTMQPRGGGRYGGAVDRERAVEL
jgi:hypothetical protein